MFYTNVLHRGKNILFRGIDKDGKRIKKTISDFKPYFYILDENNNNSDESTYKTINNQPLTQLTFDNYYKYKEKIELFTGAKNIYGNLNITSQFISTLFPHKVEFDYSKLLIISIDIETTTEHGPPDPISALEEITLITCQNIITNKTTTFSILTIEEDLEDSTHYIQCVDESDLLMRFINHIAVDYPDIITGWNSNKFDITYISNRILKKFGETALKRLSPWGSFSSKEVFSGYSNKDVVYSWDGIALIDYMDIYKKFKYANKPENFKLDTVAKHELNENKLVNPYKTFKEFYQKDPTLFVKYNIRDTNIVSNLEKKLQFLRIMAVLAYEGKCNYRDVMFTTVLWDGIIYNYLLDRGYIVPNKIDELTNYTVKIDEETSNYKIIGGYVKEPIPGLYGWSASFDATSLYPSIIMGLNISPDTIINDTSFKDLKGLKAEDKIKKFLDYQIVIEEDCYSVAANGAIFDKSKRGFIPDIIELYFGMRNKSKKKMIEYEKEYEQTKDSHLKDFKIPEYDAFQMAFKILQNSLFGALGESNFRWFDNRLAEAITSTGQLLNRNVEKSINKFLNDKFDVNKDWSIYLDTDSIYLDLSSIINLHYSNKTEQEITDIIDKMCNKILSPVIDKACKKMSSYMKFYDPSKISYKREAIASKCIFVAKKRYAMRVLNSEGVPYKDGKIKITGLEVVRSSSPQIVRQKLKKMIEVILTKENDDLKDYFGNFKEEWKTLDYDAIAIPTGVDGVEKYSDDKTTFKKGSPWHVKAVITFNKYLKDSGLDKVYDSIKDGDKIKVLYLKLPNPLKVETLAYNGELPSEMDFVKEYIDYNKLFQKTVDRPIFRILNHIGWTTEDKANLGELF